MAALTAQDILRIWETGAGQDAVGRALAILAQAAPEVSRESLAALPVGRRDERLMAVREETFGPVLDGACACPRCAERVEFTLDLARLRARLAPQGDDLEGELRFAEWHVRYRLPTSDDLAAAAARKSPDDARRALGERCLLEARRHDLAVAAHEVPPEALSRMATAMVERDPLAEVLVDFACPSCGGAGEVLLDIAAYLWEEIRAQAARLLHEVAALARAYGWRETDILALSAVRRRAYLELAT